ncbi:AzlD domain-containing protein [Leuconostoc mesenteroides]|uniref:AzlD domain-containing protein n=1 Tax=Leuconostoc mesenteroides TaxID=1245 RepID=UPI00123B1D27|nr:AzlD domain-containing protein [Leuconostoc mesenteroides]KAA8369116.1 AzlD domain-containing protein [Leuconostoc mesenteroides]MCX2665529.1 AzlD domain-containing protein [Leuconostoc mesenteroides subsp. mesenteroides]
MSDTKFYIVLLGSVMVTLIPRVIPFFMAKYINFPDWMTTFLRYLPLAMMTTLMFQNIFVVHEHGQLATVNFTALVALLPGLIIGYFRRSLMAVVLLSVLVMALMRYFNL